MDQADQEGTSGARRDASIDDQEARRTPLGLGPVDGEPTIEEATIDEATLQSAPEGHVEPEPEATEPRSTLQMPSAEVVEQAVASARPSIGSRWSVDVEEDLAQLSERAALLQVAPAAPLQVEKASLPSAFRPGPTQRDLVAPPAANAAAKRDPRRRVVGLLLLVAVFGAATLGLLFANDRAPDAGDPVTVAAPAKGLVPPPAAPPEPPAPDEPEAPEAPPTVAAPQTTVAPPKATAPRVPAATPPATAPAPPASAKIPPEKPRPIEGTRVF